MKLAVAALVLLAIAALITAEMTRCVCFLVALFDGSSAPIPLSGSSFAYNGNRFAVTKICAYWDLWAYTLVLVACVAGTRKPSCCTMSRGSATLFFCLTVVQILNSLRIAIAVYLSSHGTNWEYAHDVPDIVMRAIVYIFFGILVLRFLFVESSIITRGRGKSSHAAHVSVQPSKVARTGLPP